MRKVASVWKAAAAATIVSCLVAGQDIPMVDDNIDVGTLLPTSDESRLFSEVPSASPTVFVAPSTTRPTVSWMPTATPVPTMSPTMLPTQQPTFTPNPTASPSFTAYPTRTAYPTAVATASPTQNPAGFTASPSMALRTTQSSDITMVFEGFTEELGETQIPEWEDITSNHVVRYYQELNADLPGRIPIDVKFVQTVFGYQELRPSAIKKDVMLLYIRYAQKIEYELTESENDRSEIEDTIFVGPFDNDAKEYIVDLTLAWNLQQHLYLKLVVVGETQAPTSAPGGDGDGLSQAALRGISVSIVLASILVVVLLLWDRRKKDSYYRDLIARQDQNNIEFDNAGQPIDWRNPHTTSEAPQDAPPPPRSVIQRSGTERTADSVVTDPSGFPSGALGSENGHVSRPSNLPPLPPGRSTSGTSVGTSSFLIPVPTAGHDRHTSVADTEITDITYSDAGGGGSDRGSEIGGAPPLPQLPPISDERYYDSDGAEPPLHIRSANGSEGFSRTQSPPPGTTLGYDSINSYTAPSMTGFGLQVEELE